MCACDRDGMCPRCTEDWERDEWPEPYMPLEAAVSDSPALEGVDR